MISHFITVLSFSISYLTVFANARSDGFTRTVNMRNSGPAGQEDQRKAITYEDIRSDVHYYRYISYSQTWQSARDLCQSSMFSNRPGGCYLMLPSADAETRYLDEFLATPAYQPSVWVNLLTNNQQVFSGRNNQSVYYPPTSKIEFRTRAGVSDEQTRRDDVLIQSQIDGGWFDFQDWPSTDLATFFCECEDVCQPGVYACHDACCREAHEECDVIDGYTATCFCPKEHDICNRDVNGTHRGRQRNRGMTPSPHALRHQGSGGRGAVNVARRKNQHPNFAAEIETNDVTPPSRHGIADSALIGGACVVCCLLLSIFGMTVVKRHYRQRRERSRRETCQFQLPQQPHRPAEASKSTSQSAVSTETSIGATEHEKRVKF